MMALHISSDPSVRKILHTVFQRGALINVRPTDKGRKEIDKYSELAPYKYITDKPIRDLYDETVALLLKGERCGLVKLDIHLDRSGNIFDSFRSLYTGSTFNFLFLL